MESRRLPCPVGPQWVPPGSQLPHERNFSIYIGRVPNGLRGKSSWKIEKSKNSFEFNTYVTIYNLTSAGNVIHGDAYFCMHLMIRRVYFYLKK